MPQPEGRGVSIVTTCKGRLAFLKQTLPSMLDTGMPVTVVDFDCPERTRAFLAAHHPAVRVAAVDGQPLFNPAMARNIGARDSTGEIILFLDCDVALTPAFTRFLGEVELDNQEFFTCGLAVEDLTGTCLVSRHQFERIGAMTRPSRLGLRGRGPLPTPGSA